jgi:hypothetical protein
MKRSLVLRSLGVVLLSGLVHACGGGGSAGSAVTGSGGHAATGSAATGSGGGDGGIAACPYSFPQLESCTTKGEMCTSTTGGCKFTWTCYAGTWSGSGVTVDPNAGKVWGSGAGPASDACGASAPSAQSCVTECAQCVYGDGGCFQTFTCHGGRWTTGC